MRELGVERFTFEILEEGLDDASAVIREKHWIEQLDSFKSGYNLTPSGGFHVGNRGRKFSLEHRRKLSEAHKGKMVSAETRKKISEIQRGTKRGPQSLETKRKIGAAHRGRIIPQEQRDKISQTLSGRKLSRETRQRIGTAGRGRKHSPQTIEKMKSHVFSVEHRQKLSNAAKQRHQEKS